MNLLFQILLFCCDVLRMAALPVVVGFGIFKLVSGEGVVMLRNGQVLSAEELVS